ncbi:MULTISPECIES: HlyD family efflux transporter periplasmic adaptor subunit [unclassified Peribacillus]|uniref:HlyD family efflux transporter periplasmic adaptor subunit n=1 Tax=unclassified Peribacillus TaxID=2675266 RepID=UPI0019124110|nr:MULTISPECIES: HlyD family efflux transporter periplasmic adaptor subunit [unclassified Peribacillus]MBK5444918.1 HlyD family secretion protein [Peribacillus sp. TH24]WMX56352.1 HlyD family efflux transporter periplasmic adaptor subunit [Peribacillus sp. R9-11]
MNKGRLILINVIGLVVILAVVGGGAYYYYESTNFIKTDEAKVTGDLYTIVAPASGKLTDWDLKEGDIVSKDKKVAKVATVEGDQTVKTSAPGTVVKTQVLEDQLVQAGQTLAQTINMEELSITANIEENKLKNIEKGDSVDIIIDGDPDTVFEGTLEQIGYATTSVFSVMGNQNSSGNYTKVTQKVPVTISIKAPSDKVLPGMNAEVKISTK